MKLFTQAPIEHYTQLNNEIDPFRACFNTSAAMAVRNNGIVRHPEDSDRRLQNMCGDDLFWAFANVSQIGEKLAGLLGINPKTPNLNQWWTVMEAMLLWYLSGMKFTENGIPFMDAKVKPFVRYIAKGTLSELKREIDNGYMAIVGTYLPPTSGHIVCVSGYTDTSLVLNDPFGDANTGYAADGKGGRGNGDKVELRPDLLKHLIRDGGYMMICVHSDLRNPLP